MSEANPGIDHGLNDDAVVDQITALINEQDKDEPDTPEKVAAEAPEETQALEEDVEAEEVVEEAPEINYDLEIPMPDGRDAMTIGAMKDALSSAERTKSEVEEQRIKLIADEERLNQFMAQTGVEIPPEFTQHVQQQQKQYLEDQHRLMLKMIPETGDKTAFEGIRAGIVETAAKSNFTPQEIAKVSDARIVHLLHRLNTLEQEKARASEKVAQIKQKTGPKGVPRRQTGKRTKLDKQVEHAIGSHDSDAKGAAIEALLAS